MKARGFSLVEVVLILSIISILVAIGTLKFIDYANIYKTEAETRTLYSAFVKARADAVYQRRATRIKLYVNRFEVYSSTEDNSKGVAPVESQTLPYRVSCNGSGDGERGYTFDFDSRGLAGQACTICVENSEMRAGLDSIVISEFRVRTGKKDKGDECKRDNVTIR